MLLNVTKVVKELKRSTHIFWAKKDNKDYVCNGYWAIKVDLKKIENRKILGYLVETFGDFPPDNKIISIIKNAKDSLTITNILKDSWLSLLEIEDKKIIEDTRLTLDIFCRGDQTRIFRGENYIYLNTKYLEMIDVAKSKIYGDKPLNPVVFTDGNEAVVILPVRIHKSDGMEYLKNSVSREDLEGLVKTLDINIYALKEGAVNGAIESLTKLRDNIEANLREDCN